jgi:hypothetical protein
LIFTLYSSFWKREFVFKKAEVDKPGIFRATKATSALSITGSREA